MGLKICLSVGFKGIVSWDFVACLLVSFNISDACTHEERFCLLLKIWFCDKFLFLTQIELNCAKLFQIVLNCIKIVLKWVEWSQIESNWVNWYPKSNGVKLLQIESNIAKSSIAFEVKLKAKSFYFIILMQFFETKILLFQS
jgi:hypothetical protein